MIKKFKEKLRKVKIIFEEENEYYKTFSFALNYKRLSNRETKAIAYTYDLEKRKNAD